MPGRERTNRTDERQSKPWSQNDSLPFTDPSLLSHSLFLTCCPGPTVCFLEEQTDNTLIHNFDRLECSENSKPGGVMECPWEGGREEGCASSLGGELYVSKDLVHLIGVFDL